MKAATEIMAQPESWVKNTGEKSRGEKYPVGEKSSKNEPEMNTLVKNRNPLESKSKDFSPTYFSPTLKRDFSPTKKAKLALVKNRKNGVRGRPRNPDLPPSPAKYFSWQKARNGFKLENRKPYQYIGYIRNSELEELGGIYDDEYILRAILAAIRVKRARSITRARTS